MNKITKDDIAMALQSAETKLKSTHDKLCIPIINRISLKMSKGITFPCIKLDGDLIIDGHHRYVASLLTKFNLESVPFTKTSATVEVDWVYVSFVDEDWDTQAKIDMLDK